MSLKLHFVVFRIYRYSSLAVSIVWHMHILHHLLDRRKNRILAGSRISCSKHRGSNLEVVMQGKPIFAACVWCCVVSTVD